MLDRRQFLFATFAAPALAQRPETASIDRGFARVSRIADGVYATVADPTKGPQALSNGGVMVGRDAVLLIEGHFQPAAAALEIEAARTLSKAPIRGAINTHFHLDHTFGNQGYARERIPILAHERVAELMKQKYAALQGVEKGPLLAPLEHRVAEARNAEEKRRAQSDLDAVRWMYGGIDATTLTYPTESLFVKDLPMKIELGGLTAVIEFHRGHTPTDLIVRVPEREVVFTGDLLFEHQYPVCLDADMAAWWLVLDRFAGYGPRTQFVPGHGPVCGMDVVREQQALFEDLRAHAQRMKKAGASAEEAARRYTVPVRFKGFEVFAWGWNIGAAMESYYRE